MLGWSLANYVVIIEVETNLYRLSTIKPQSTMFKYLITVLLLIAVGCASQNLARKREKLAEQGLSNDYIDGYVDGCSSGYMRAGDRFYDFSRDMPRYQADQSYSKGWDEGFDACKSHYESLMKTFDTLTSD